MIPKPKKKKMKISTEREKALSEFQRYSVERCATSNGFVICFSCGCVMHISEADGGHGIPKKYHVTELEPTNCWPQCRYCNRYLDGNQYKYMSHLAEEYGQEEVDRLNDMVDAHKGSEEALLRLSEEDIKKVKMKRTAEFYHEQYLYYKAKRKKLQDKKNG